MRRCFPSVVLILAAMGLLGCEAGGGSQTAKVPDVIGKTAGSAEETITEAKLRSSFRDIPTDDRSCRVVAQKPRPGTELEESSDVNLRCEVKVPNLVGRKAEPAESKLSAAGLESRLRNEPSDLDLSRCRVASQSKRGAAPPGSVVALDLTCKEAPAPPEPAPLPEEPPPEESAPAGNCDPNYDPCVPTFPPDVNCPDLDGPVRVTGSDPHGLDRDGDGSACE